MENMEKNPNQKIEKAPSEAEIKKWKELINQKFYKHERYSNVDEIDSENEETLLSNFRQEIKEIQEEIKKGIDIDLQKREYCNRTATLGLKPDYLTVEEAKIWELFKLVKTFEDLRIFESLIFRPYKENVKEEINKEIEPGVKEMMANPNEKAKALIEAKKKDFQNSKKWGNANVVDMSEEELIFESIKKDIFYSHPRVVFGWDLMGNRLGDKTLILKAEQELKKLKEAGYEI